VRALVGDVRHPVRRAPLMRRAAVVALAVVALAACSGDGDNRAAPSSTVARPSTTAVEPPPTSISAPATTAPPNTIADGPCGGQFGFGESYAAYASANNSPWDYTIERFGAAASDTNWARALAVPDAAAGLDASWVVAHCDGKTWVIQDSGTSGVGCRPPVPRAVIADLGYDC
jgi:hypothetical protein